MDVIVKNGIEYGNNVRASGFYSQSYIGTSTYVVNGTICKEV